MTKSNGNLDHHARQLEALLKKERELLLSGEARRAAELNADKLAFMELLEPHASGRASSEPLPANLDTIKRLAGENASILSALLNGLRSALARLSRLEHDASTGTYDESGIQQPFDSATGQYQRKF
jgi:hypothetical protein